jgi:hypothetical protein
MGFFSFFSGATDGGGYTGAEDGGYGLEGGLGQSSGPGGGIGGGYTGAEEGGLGQSSGPGGGIGGGYTGAEDGGYGLEGGLGQSSVPGGGIGGGVGPSEEAAPAFTSPGGGIPFATNPFTSPGGGIPFAADYDVDRSLAEKAVEVAKSMFTVRGDDGKPNVPLTVLDIAARGLIPGYGIVRGGMSAIDAIFGPTTMTAEEAAAEQENYTALAEASLSPESFDFAIAGSQGQQDPAAQQALFGPTHIYGALPGQARRRGAYQYIPPTFGPRS